MWDPGNVREVADTGPDFLGFIFYPGSKRYVGANPDAALFQQITGGIMQVGVFVNENPERVLELASDYALNLVQLHGSETAQYCQTIRSAGYKVIKAFGVDAGFDFDNLAPYLPVCDYFLFDTKSDLHGGSGLKFGWEKIQQYNFGIPFFLSGGIDPNDSGAIREIKHPAFFAVDINSLFEVEPGMKNVNQVKAFIKEIKTVEP